jgi:hypothetical protein
MAFKITAEEKKWLEKRREAKADWEKTPQDVAVYDLAPLQKRFAGIINTMSEGDIMQGKKGLNSMIKELIKINKGLAI